MGKGGQKITKTDLNGDGIIDHGIGLKDGQVFLLEHLNIEELRKWAKAYGVKGYDKLERKVLLSELNPLAGGILDTNRPANLPLERPTFTLSTIQAAIPKHCFKRNLFTSLSHLFSDLVLIAIFGYLATYISHPSLPVWSHYILWPIYWYGQGSVMTGLWVLAHECGHESFSESEVINNFIGTILHSALLVPYHSWRITHKRHHSNTGSVENDEVFAPCTRSGWAGKLLRESPIANAYGIFLMLTVGWMPGYLIFGITGPEKYAGKNVNHFSPTAIFFEEKDYWKIVRSVICYFIAVGIIAYSIFILGFKTVGTYYLLPLVVVNYHLVLITFLQHTDVYMPHFRGDEWNWLRGALCTVDRSFGPVLDHTLHHIVDTHVCHHLFSKMPFYHAQEATEAIKKVLGPFYLKDETPIAKATYRAFSNCQFIEDEGSIVFYKNKF